jgi:ligand-binding sensor domain-containing protein
MWFGTETGLSRFDGTHFKSFTKDDGLPDNEIIQLFADSRGRIWISPFKKTVCYYYKGKLHTQSNDSTLRGLHIQDNIVRFTENTAGDILMQEVKRLHVVRADNRVDNIDKINDQPFSYISAISPGPNGGFRLTDGNRLYEFSNNHFYLKRTLTVFNVHFRWLALSATALVWRKTSMTSVATTNGIDRFFPYFPYPHVLHINYNIIDENHISDNTSNGAVVYNSNSPDSSQYFLPGLSVSNALKDAEGNLWFSTLGHGLYRLSSAFILNIKFTKNNLPVQVLSLARYNQSILVGTETNIIYRLNALTGNLEKENIVIPLKYFNPVGFLYTLEEKKIICGASDISLFKLTQFKRREEVTYISVKALFPYKHELLVATRSNVFVINPETFKITDTIWNERSTTVFAHNDTIYIGTLDGLYRRLPDKSIEFLGEKTPELKTRITAIQKDESGVVWAGTYGDGLIGYKNGRIVARLTWQNGLTSSVCRTMVLHNNTLWVGTDKGLNKINLAQPGYPVTKYTTGDGLASDLINAIYIDSNKVFVGTPEGVTFFDEQKVASQSYCKLTFTDITIGGQAFDPTEMPSLIPHAKNDIRFNYVGISYKSAGDIRYRYRLLGLDSNWKETRETFLSYPTLPSGDYQLEVQAINKFDVISKVITASFTIEKLIWEKNWFRLLIGLVFLTLTALLVWFIIHRIQKREQEKTTISKRIGELEQLARKAQMNPHFIFNSLNSIQQYVMDADITGANKFISGFSRLIRQTLDFSSKPEISLEQELDYLSNYLELERTRLENAFSWSVTVAEDVHAADYFIPPMILQPFVENSVRHGLRFRRDRDGKVSIDIKKENDHLICILEDNGIGRKAALQFKSANAIEYQSKGMSLTAERIAMLNKDNSEKITMQIDDLEDDQQKPSGTKVTIKFPVS